VRELITRSTGMNVARASQWLVLVLGSSSLECGWMPSLS